MDVSNRIRTHWHGTWIWGNFITPRRKIYADRAAEPKELSRDEINTFILGRKKFQVSDEIKKATIYISADSRYKLFINGKYVGRGINRCEANFWYYDEYDVTKYLKRGLNVLAFKARWFGWHLAYYTPPENPGLNLQNAAKGGVIFDLVIEYNSGKKEWIFSDKDTKIIEDPSQRSDMPKKNGALGYIEECDNRKIAANWNETDYDDSNWKNALELQYPIVTLIKDENSPLYEAFNFPSEIISIGETDDIYFDLEDDEKDEIDFNIQHMLESQPEPLEHFEIKNKEALVGPEGDFPLDSIPTQGPVEIIPLKGSEEKVISIFIKFSREMVGYPRLIVEGTAGTIIDIIPAEKKRDNYSPNLGFMQDKRGARLILREGRQFFEQWTWEGYLYMLIKIRNLKAPLKIHLLGTNRTRMQTRAKGKFASDIEDINKLWNACSYTLECCAIDSYLDCPSREQRAYLGDAYTEALISNACFGEPRLTKKIIEDACFGQRSDGIMYSFHPGDAPLENHIIPDYSLYLIQIAKDYYQYYGDWELMEQAFPHFVQVVEWFWKYIDPEDNLLCDIPYWIFIDWSFGPNKKGKWAIINAQFMDILDFLAYIAEMVGCRDLMDKYRSQSQIMKNSIEKTFWDEQKGFYRDYLLDGRLYGQSFMTNAYLIEKKVAPKEKWEQIIKAIFDYPGADENERKQIDEFYLKMESHHKFGEKNKDLIIVAQPFFMHHVHKALAKVGRFDLILKFIKKWIPMLKLGETGTIWETWSKAGSECHAWSATPAYDLSTYWLGVRPLSPGFEHAAITPTFYGFNSVEGEFPTIRGPIFVKWDKEQRTMDGNKQQTTVRLMLNIPKEINSSILTIPPYNGAAANKITHNGNNLDLNAINYGDGYKIKIAPGKHEFSIEYGQ